MYGDDGPGEDAPERPVYTVDPRIQRFFPDKFVIFSIPQAVT